MSLTQYAGASLSLLIVLVPAATGMAQPTIEMLGRVVMVESPVSHERGTIFVLEVDQREYWITAKHMLTGAKHPPYGSIERKQVLLRMLNPNVDPTSQGEQWVVEPFEVIDPGKDIDIVVLAPSTAIMENPLAAIPTDSSGAVLGSDCEFLGFPFGAAWRGTFENGKMWWMPFVKHCTISASSHPVFDVGQRVWVLDGINNGGFSGGPVFFGTGPNLKIMAVVSSFQTEPTDVIPSDPAVKPNATVNVNSGFFVAFDIVYAIDAIHKNPIGPLRKGQ